ncbi:glycosyltransferase [Seonamhaeicola sp. S2-3]|uniref:glycosyltransferase n=1 Tax=Seonamhaeicola sp. S2-3 TaxID=1936081 RepID=UPI0009727573|nr:glycosyltransferase [Seonamhaeicola sp. S2-3]APY09990.1 glycosyltransferase [Seonamhaeicola sp. S2-3]
MRVIQIIDSLEPGGAERVAVNFANALADKIDQSFLCATRKEGLLKASLNSNVGYLFLNKTGTLDLKAVFKLHTFLKKHQVDIIHAHSSSFFIATIIKVLNPKYRLVWHDHYGNRDQASWINKFVLKLCSRYFSAIIAVNQKLKNRSQKSLLCKHVYFLVNYPIASLNSEVTKLRGSSGKRIVCVANMRPDKDHGTLIRAFNEVLKTYPDWTLHCVGKDFNDAYSKSVKRLIHNLKLEPHIFIYGSCPDVFHILSQSTIGVLSSKSEGLPLALLEYGMAGLPSVATNVGDCNLVISTKDTGVLVEKEDVNALKEGLITFIANERLRQDVGENFKKSVIHSFSEEAQIHKLIEIYKLHKK